MTKVYLVMTERINADESVSNYVEGVFTNKKLAENYVKWVSKIPLKEFWGIPKDVKVYINTREICRKDYSKLPF